MKKKILFIINPKSGTKDKKNLSGLILENIDKNIFAPEIKITEYAGHASLMTKEAVEKNHDVICAVGGDGTMNEVARELIDKKTSLAVIPIGSGNALARYFGFSMNIKKAIQQINSGKIIWMDVCKANDKYFFNAAGIGFDAMIAHLFSKRSQRGFWGYFLVILKELFFYKTKNYSIFINGKSETVNAFLIVFANSNQYGNDFVIAPNADIQDCKIEVLIIKKFPPLLAPYLFLLLFLNKQQWTKYFFIRQTSKIKIECDEMKQLHIDGEPIDINGKLEIEVKPISLSVLIP